MTSIPATETSADRRGGRRRVPRWSWATLGVVVLLLVLAGVWSLVSALEARSTLTTVRADLTAVRDHPADRADVERRLTADAERAHQAKGAMHQLGPEIVSHLPLVGRSITAERVVADAASAVLDAARPVVADTDGLGGAGAGLDLTRLAALHRDLQSAATTTAGPLQRLAHLDTGLTPAVVGRSVRQAQHDLGGLTTDFTKASSLTDAVGDLLGAHGPRTIYLGLENNTELRGTGGLISTFTIGHAAGGKLTLEKFRDSTGIAKIPSHAVTVPAPADYTNAYGGYAANSTIWLDATMDPDIPTSASVIAALGKQSFGRAPDAVLLLDVAGMADLVTATGPLHLSNGTTLSGSQLVKELLVTEYGDGSLDQNATVARHQELAEAAGSGFATLTAHESDLGVLKALANAAGGRHLALWSSTPSVEAELDAAGVSGSVRPTPGQDLGLVTVNNLGDSPSYGNKLDYYESRSLDVKVVLGEHSADVTETLTIGNHAPDGLGPYVEGPAHPGRMHLLVSLAAPTSGHIEQVTGDHKPLPVTLPVVAGSTQVTFPVDLERGQSGTYQLEYTVPVNGGRYSLRLLPQPLAAPASLSVEVSAAAGSRLGTVTGTGSRQWRSTVTVHATLHHTDWWHSKIKI